MSSLLDGLNINTVQKSQTSESTVPKSSLLDGISVNNSNQSQPSPLLSGVNLPSNPATVSPATPTPSPYFYKETATGATIGKSDTLDSSGKPLMAYRNPGDTSTTTDTTRIAPTFDPTVAEKHTAETFKTPRAVQSRAVVKQAMGGTYSDELDHKIALELSGSNDRSNLRIESNVSGTKNTATDPLENSLARDVASGKISLFDAQVQLAKAKGISVPWTPPGAKPATPGIWDKFKGYVAGLFKPSSSPQTLPGASKSPLTDGITLDTSKVNAPGLTVAPSSQNKTNESTPNFSDGTGDLYAWLKGEVTPRTEAVPYRQAFATDPIQTKAPPIITQLATLGNGILEALPRLGVTVTGEVVGKGQPTVVKLNVDLRRFGFEGHDYLTAAKEQQDAIANGENPWISGLRIMSNKTLDVAFGASMVANLMRTASAKLLVGGVEARLEAQSIVDASKANMSDAMKRLKDSPLPEKEKVMAELANMKNQAQKVLSELGAPTQADKARAAIARFAELTGRETPMGPGYVDRMAQPDLGTKKPIQQPVRIAGQLPGYKDAAPNPVPAGLSTKPVEPVGFAEKPPVYEGEKDLTTKVLTRLEGRDTVSKQFISDLTNSADLKQQERDIVRSVLEGYTGEVPIKEFAEKVKAELLPLRRSFVGSAGEGTSRYESITLPDEQRGNVANYSEHIYNSPVKTSAGDIHFSQSTSGSGYFGHTRTEDMADGNQEALRKMIKENGQPKTPDDVHKYAGAGGTRRIIEVQSDLYQKGRVETSTRYDSAKRVLELNNAELLKNDTSSERKDFLREHNKELESIMKEDGKLNQYSNPTAHFRMVREEVKQAAKDGKSTLLFPTGETAMKIEGLGVGRQAWEHKVNGKMELLNPNDLKVGKEVTDNDNDWIITDVLGDGKFKAVSKNAYEGATAGKTGAAKDSAFKILASSNMAETFDISGKVDTNNPIYRFYEKDLGRYLANKYGAKPFTDEKGVTWNKVDVKPEQATKPVEAFKKGGKKFGYTRSIEEVKSAIHTVLKEAGIKDPQKAAQLMFSKDFLPKFADGLYQRSINPRLAPLIKIFEEDGKASVFTGIHEAAHFILDPENGLITESEKKALLDETRKSMTLLQKGYYAARGYRGDKIMEEKIADEWAKQKASEQGFHGPLKRALELFDRLVGKVSSAIKRTFEKLNEYLPKENRQGGFAKIPFGDDLNESIAKKKGITEDPRETLKNAEKRAGVKPVLPVKEENISLKADREDRLAANKGTAEMKKIDARASFSDSLKIRLPADLEAKATALEIRRHELETSPLNAGLKYIAKNGEFKGRVPEVTGKPGRGDFAQFGDRKLSEITGTSDTEKGREMINDHAAAWKKYEADAVKFKNERQAFLSKARSERDQIIENQKIGRMHEKMDKRASDIQDEAARKERVARAAAEGQAKAQAEALKRTTLQEKINVERAKSSLPTSFMERLKQKFFPVKSLEPKTKGIVENWYTDLSKATETAQSAWREVRAKGPQTWSEVLDYEAGKKTPYIFEAEEALYDKAKKNGIPLNHVEDHLMHIWDKKGPAVMQAAEKYLKSKGLSEAEIKAYVSGQPLSEAQSLRLKLRPDFSKARIFPDYKTGIKFGLRPKFRTPAQIIAYETEALDKAIANKKMIETLKSEAKLLPEEDKPDNWIPVTSRFAGRQTLYAEPRLAEFLNGRYRDEENLSLGQMMFKGMTTVTRGSTHFVLTTGLPGTNIHSFGIGIGLYKPMTTAVGALAEAPVRALTGDFASSAAKIREVGTALKQTVALLRSNFTPWSRSFMEDHADDILNMSRAGIALDGRSDYYTKFGESFFRSMVNHGGDLMGSVKELGSTPGKAVKDITVTSFNTFKTAWNKFFALDKTWELMNQQKVILFGDTIRAAKRAGMDDESALKFAADITRKGMGIPETPNSGRSMDTEEQITSMFIVPQYREGVMNILWNGFKGSSWKFKDPSYSFNRSLVVGAALTYVAYNIINKKLNGHYMWDNPAGREFSIRLPQADGSALYTDMMPSILTIPRNAAEGAFAFVKGDWATATQKASSVLSLPLAATINAFTNKDYFGRPIYNVADSALKKAEKVSLYWTGQQTSPAITELVKYFNGDETAAEAFTRIIQLPIRFSKATTERYSAMQDLYDSNQKLKASGKTDDANKLFNALSDADKKIYTQIKRSTEAANTTARKPDILGIYKSNQQLIADGNKSEADAIYYGLSQNDQRIYNSIKKAAQKNGK